MVDIISKVFKDKEYILSKDGIYEMVIQIMDVSSGQTCHFDILLKKYTLFIEEGARVMYMDGIKEFPIHTISNVHNRGIREVLSRTLKHFNVEKFSLQLRK